MSDAAPFQVIDALVARLQGHAPLSGHTIVADNPEDTAFDDAAYPVVSIALQLWSVEQDVQQGQSRHTIEVDFEVVSGKETPGVISRNNAASIAHVIAAIAQDRTMGGLIEDIQESDAAPAGQMTRDASATSLRATATFYTPRNDWFQIIS